MVAYIFRHFNRSGAFWIHQYCRACAGNSKGLIRPVLDSSCHSVDLRVSYDNKVNKEVAMLQWSITFLIVAIIAGFLGFGGIAGTATDIAKILFGVFLILFLVSLVFGRRFPTS